MSLQMTDKRFYNTQETLLPLLPFFLHFFYFWQTNILTNVKSINKNVKAIVLYLWVPKHQLKHKRPGCQSAQLNH